MGKNFGNELKNLKNIYDCAYHAEVDTVAQFLSEFKDTPIIGVGSGGSYSVAAAMDYMCKKAGIFSRSTTPLELCDLIKIIGKVAFILFTAGGGNNDTKNSYKFISELESKGLLTCCMRIDAPIKKLQRNNMHEWYYEYKMPVRKDGYLAVESYVSSIVILAKAFHKITGKSFFELKENRKWCQKEIDNSSLKKVLERETIIVLHSGITSPVAIDLESKFSEGALGNISLVDFRNFAHGRHFWLSHRREKTGIIALVGKRESSLADKTIKLIPEEIPVMRKDFDDSSIDALFDVIDYELHFVLETGKFRGIDPGKPKVEEFGKKMYHINHNICMLPEVKNLRNDTIATGIYRKINEFIFDKKDCKYTNAKEVYYDIYTKEFEGLVFDYDGTLHDKRVEIKENEKEKSIFSLINDLLDNDILIGIATGRGHSVRDDLQEMIDKKHWNKVIISYYNGAVTGLLSDNLQPDKSALPIPKSFFTIDNYLKNNFSSTMYETDDLEKDKNPYQFTVLTSDAYIKKELGVFVSGLEELKMVQSSHSIDIIPKSSTKNNIFSYFNKIGISEENILCIGDSGNVEGNDYDILNRKYALSVDTVSEKENVCWNFSKLGNRNLDATKEYLELIEIKQNGKFVLKEEV